jgi:hypothetical protein
MKLKLWYVSPLAVATFTDLKYLPSKNGELESFSVNARVSSAEKIVECQPAAEDLKPRLKDLADCTVKIMKFLPAKFMKLVMSLL